MFRITTFVCAFVCDVSCWTIHHPQLFASTLRFKPGRAQRQTCFLRQNDRAKPTASLQAGVQRSKKNPAHSRESRCSWGSIIAQGEGCERTTTIDVQIQN